MNKNKENLHYYGRTNIDENLKPTFIQYLIYKRVSTGNNMLPCVDVTYNFAFNF